MARNRYRSRRSEVFNALRIEAWQQQLTRGDCFLLLVKPGVALWGVTEAEARDGAWHATLYSETSPDGVQEIVKVTDMDLPVTTLQFAAARRTHWPCEMEAIKVIISMADVAAA